MTAERGRRRLLVVDDHARLRSALADFLGSGDDFVVVGSVGDGETAVRELARSRAEAVVLDVNLPGGGPDLVRALRSVDPAVRVVCYSVNDAMRAVMMAAGADAFVVKGESPSDLVRALDRLVT